MIPMGSQEYLKYKQQLDEIRKIAQDAAQVIMDIYRSSFEITYKSDSSPLTEADHASHRLILARLADLKPALPVLSCVLSRGLS